MIDTYTRLLEVAAESEDDAVSRVAVEKLVAHLRSAGRLKILPSIVHELRKVKARREALRARVEVAHDKDAPDALLKAKEMGVVAKHAQVNPALVSGWRASGGGMLVDLSGKRALIDIYKNATK